MVPQPAAALGRIGGREDRLADRRRDHPRGAHRRCVPDRDRGPAGGAVADRDPDRRFRARALLGRPAARAEGRRGPEPSAGAAGRPCAESRARPRCVAVGDHDQRRAISRPQSRRRRPALVPAARADHVRRRSAEGLHRHDQGRAAVGVGGTVRRRHRSRRPAAACSRSTGSSATSAGTTTPSSSSTGSWSRCSSSCSSSRACERRRSDARLRGRRRAVRPRAGGGEAARSPFTGDRGWTGPSGSRLSIALPPRATASSPSTTGPTAARTPATPPGGPCRRWRTTSRR